MPKKSTFTIQFNRFPQVAARMRHRVPLVVAKTAEDGAAITKRNIVANGQVDTGAMLNSVIAIQVSPYEWLIVVVVYYAIFQERGTRFMAGRAFLLPAVREIRGPFQKAMGQLVRS